MRLASVGLKQGDCLFKACSVAGCNDVFIHFKRQRLALPVSHDAACAFDHGGTGIDINGVKPAINGEVGTPRCQYAIGVARAAVLNVLSFFTNALKACLCRWVHEIRVAAGHKGVFKR